MKISKYDLVLVIAIFNCANIFSQNITGITGQTLWLKNQNEQSAQRSTDGQLNTYFNFNPIFSPLQKDLQHKNILSAKYSLFVVFKSDVKQENNLFRLNSNGKEVQITNNQIISSKNTEFNKKVDVTDGIVLGYFVSAEEKKNRKKNQLLIENLSAANSGSTNRNDLMELLYYPRILEIDEKQKVESYLSVKYGISLLGNTDYVDSDGNKIWNYEYNKAYNNRVTGIGRNDAMALNQKQSGNAKKDGLYIGLGTIENNNALNKNSLADKRFLLWGDNNGTTTLTVDRNDTSGAKKMKRIWKIQRSGENIADEFQTQVLLRKNEMVSLKANPDDKKEEPLWLVVDRNGSTAFDYQNAEYYRLSAEDDEKILFNTVVWDIDKSGADTFTFIKASDFFIDHVVADPNYIASEEGKTNPDLDGKAPDVTGNAANGWIIYPNPVQREDPFTIRFNLKEPSDVTVAIYDMSNKLIQTKKIGLIQEFEYTNTLSLNGTFMVVVTVNGISQSAKLIIQ